MPDIVDSALPELHQHRLPDLNLGEEFVHPYYGGRSILNLPDSVCFWLGAPPLSGRPLAPDLLEPFAGGVQRVILILADALALHRLRGWLTEGSLPAWQSLIDTGLLAPLTSITPSTTSAALSSLWTGRSAAEHGITGYEMWLKEYGLVANTILQGPMSMQGGAAGVGSLAQAGFTPEGFLPFTTLGTHLAGHGVQTYAFQHFSILRSGLSQMFFRSVHTQGFSTSADLWINVRQLVERRSEERQYIYVYWSEVDSLSHHFGPDDERVQASFASFSASLQSLFLERLSPALRRGTLLVLTADHGQIATWNGPHYELRNHPTLVRRLHIFPTGENRLAYFYPRPGQYEAVREYLARAWPNNFVTLDSPYAVEAGLFGPGQPHPALLDRVGDLIALARGRAYLWWSAKDDPLLGRHGGLHPEEMLVPFLAARL